MYGVNQKNRIIAFMLMLLCVFSTIWFNTMFATADGASDALGDSSGLYTNQTCACAKKYTTVTPKQNSKGEIESVTTDYTYSSATATHCVYTHGSETINVSCGGQSGSTLMSKYVTSGLLSSTEADTFVRDASVYASYVQANLATKTQKQGFGTTATENLGNGAFNRAMFEFNNNAHFVYSFLIGFSFITAMLVFILIFMKMTWLPDHPIKRREAMEDMVTSGVSVILTGGIWIVISLFQSIFDNFWSTYAVYSKDWKTVGNMFLYEYKGLVIGILGLAALTAMLMFIKNFVGLSFSGDNPQQRKQKMISLLLCGCATAGLGGLAIFMGFFWNLLR